MRAFRHFDVRDERTVDIPPGTAGAIIGTGGCNIRRIRESCRGLRTCQILHSGLQARLVGSKAAIDEAVAMIDELAATALSHQLFPRRPQPKSDGKNGGISRLSVFSPSKLDVQLTRPSPEANKHLEIIAGPQHYPLYAYDTVDREAWAPARDRSDLFAELTVFGRKHQCVASASVAPLARYMQTLHEKYAEIDSVRDHHAHVAIGKSFFQPWQHLGNHSSMSLEQFMAQIPKMRQQFSSGGISSTHVDAAKRWCEMNGYDEIDTSRTMTLNIHDANEVRTHLMLTLPPDLGDWEDLSAAEIAALENDYDTSPRRLAFVSTHLPGESQLEARLTLKAKCSNEVVVPDDLMGAVVAAWSCRDPGACLVLDPSYGLRIESLRLEELRVWSNGRFALVIKHVIQRYSDTPDDATFWTMQYSSQAMESVGYMKVSREEFARELVELTGLSHFPQRLRCASGVINLLCIFHLLCECSAILPLSTAIATTRS